MSGRKCGPCTMCCTALAVPELGKANGERCRHLTDAGCGIYEERPESCRAFECSWLQGNGDISVRPDRTKTVVTWEDGGLGHGAEALVFYTQPEHPDAWTRSAYLRKMVQRAVELGSGAFIMQGDTRKLITKPGSRLHQKVSDAKRGGA